MQQTLRWHIFKNADAVAEAACQQILKAAEQAIAQHGQFKCVLAGGTTPEKIYRLLALTDADWANWMIYFGDERCLPPDHADRNSQLAIKTLLDRVPIPAGQIFTMPAEQDPKTAAELYAPMVAEALPFDLVLLGMGEDGHTASLFPGHSHPTDELTHAVYNSPKPPSERVTISAKALSNSRQVIFLVTGANKQTAVKAWRDGASLPVATIATENPIDVLIDQDAYGAQ